MTKTRKTDNTLTATVQRLKQMAIEQKVGLWKRIAEDLEMPTRQRRIVNVYVLSQHTREDETIVVPGKVLAAGAIDHRVNVAAWAFSGAAKQKILKAKGNCLTIPELLQKNPAGKNVRIIG